MKRRELERKLRIAGCYLKREGSSHSLWINPKNSAVEAVPRHAEIKEPPAKKNSEKPRRRMTVPLNASRVKPPLPAPGYFSSSLDTMPANRMLAS